MAALRLYTKENCPACHRARRMLRYLQIAYEERRVDEVPEHRRRVASLGFRAVPVVEVDGVGAVPGSDPAQVERLLLKAGWM